MRDRWKQLAGVAVIAMLFIACGDAGRLRRTLRSVGAHNLRTQTLAACRDGFATRASQKIADELWPESVRAFHPLGLWAEPDGAYLLIESDADGERGLYLPRFVSEKDPLCSPSLKHEKLADGVYWYDRKR